MPIGGPSMPMPSMPLPPPGTSAGTINLGQVSMPYNMETYGNSGAIGASMPYGGPSIGASMPYGASVPMGGPSMGASVPMGTSAGLQGTMPFVVQPGTAGLVGSATAGDFPQPGPGPMQPMMPPGMPAATSASIPAVPMQPAMPAPGPAMPAPMPMPAPGPVSAPGPAVQQQWIPGPARPIMTSVAAPPVVGGAPQNPISYGPSYNMSYHVRSTADKTAVKYTGFLPMEGVFEEDTCRIG